MRLKAFYKHLEGISIAPLYLFKGDEDFLIREAWYKMREKLLPQTTGPWNGERVKAEEVAAREVILRLNTAPLLGDRRLMMVEHVESWSREQRRIIEDYAANPNSQATVVFTISLKHDWRELENLISKHGFIVIFSDPTEQDALLWVSEHTRKLGKRMSNQVAKSLVSRLGADLFRLNQELQKVSAFVGDKPEIELADVNEVISQEYSFEIFDLTRHIGEGKLELAIACLQSLITRGESPLAILALLARHIRLLWQIKDGIERKMPLENIRRKLHLPSRAVNQLVQQARFFTIQDLRRNYEAIAETDLTLKTTPLEPEAVLQLLVLKLCGQTALSQGAKDSP